MAQQTKAIPALLYYATKICPWVAVGVVIWGLATGRDKELEAAFRHQHAIRQPGVTRAQAYQMPRNDEDSACEHIRSLITDPDKPSYWALTVSGYEQIQPDEIDDYVGTICQNVRRVTRDSCTYIDADYIAEGYRAPEADEPTPASRGGEE